MTQKLEKGLLPTKQDLKSVKGKDQDNVVIALTQAIGPDEAIKLLEQCDMSKHAAKLVPNKKCDPDGPLPKWGEPPVDAMKKTPGQKKVAEGKDSEHSWKAEGHYTKDGKEWKGLQHVYKGQIMTGKTHTDESEPLYHFKQLEKDVQQKVHAKIQSEACWKGWKKRGMKKKGDRMVPNCVKEASPQDPDIKDREGTQPAAYHKGLKKTQKPSVMHILRSMVRKQTTILVHIKMRLVIRKQGRETCLNQNILSSLIR